MTSSTKSAIHKPARLAVEKLEAREVLYSASGNAWMRPDLITISFVPDGTVIGANGSGPITSNLFATMNAKWSTATWQAEILKAAQVWAQQTNINFKLVADDGADIGTGSYQQGDPNHGDIRIGGYDMGTAVDSPLASAYLPPPVNNYDIAGDMQFNTARNWTINQPTVTYDLFTVAMHEFGHTLGLNHSSAGSTAAMWPSWAGRKTALTTDDVNGIRAVTTWSNALFSSPGYGGARAQDSYDAAAANGTFATAKDISSTINATSKTSLITDRDLTSLPAAADLDFYKFTVPAGMGGTLTVTAQSAGLSLLAPTLTLYNSAQAQLTTASGAGQYGTTVTNTYSVTAGQVYYVKVAGADSTSLGSGEYALTLAFAGVASPTVPLPTATTTLNDPNPATGGGQAVSMGAEFRVNTYTTGVQQAPNSSGKGVAMDAAGNYVVTWTSYGQDGSGEGIYAQRYDAAGNTLGAEFLVNTTTAGDQKWSNVARDAAGNFVVVWTGDLQDGSNLGVFAQRFDAAGNKVGGEFRVNTYTSNTQSTPSIAMNASGAFVIAWISTYQDGSLNGIYAQRYDSSGVAQGGEFRVNTTTAGDQISPAVAMDAAGNFAVVWTDYDTGDNNLGTKIQRYDAVGNKVGGQVRVSSSTTYGGDNPAVALDASGNYIVAWSSYGRDGSSYGIFARRFNSSGAALGGDFQVNTYTTGSQTLPRVAIASGGNFFITWESDGQDGSNYGVYAQQFTSTGVKQGTEFRINTTTSGPQRSSSMAMDANGNAVITWAGNGSGDADGIFGQRYQVTFAGLQPMVEEVNFHTFDPTGDDHDHEDAHTIQVGAPAMDVGAPLVLSAPAVRPFTAWCFLGDNFGQKPASNFDREARRPDSPRGRESTVAPEAGADRSQTAADQSQAPRAGRGRSRRHDELASDFEAAGDPV